MKKTISLLRRGFTLIELLVVIAIIGILAAVVLASLNDARDSGSDASAKTSMNNFRNQAELYYNDNSYNYNGVCTASTTAALRTAIDTQTTNSNTCTDSATAYAMYVQLRSTDTFCVDSTGYAGIPTTAPSGSVTVCQ